MKKILLFSAVLLGIFLTKNTFAQDKISKITPTHIIWNVNGSKTTLKEGSYGVGKADSLTIKVFFKDEIIRNLEGKGSLDFEFRWYYYFSTKKKLVETQVIKFSQDNYQQNGSYLISSTKKNISKGWWEVQIISKNDNGYLRIGKLKRFQIFVKN